jgi:hypothetical protein
MLMTFIRGHHYHEHLRRPSCSGPGRIRHHCLIIRSRRLVREAVVEPIYGTTLLAHFVTTSIMSVPNRGPLREARLTRLAISSWTTVCSWIRNLPSLVCRGRTYLAGISKARGQVKDPDKIKIGKL